ncbi:M4 family metallopeptidase [Pseudalkalibacillus caeni]|uniref:Neutral metalloproteinase n=1 Tax=Exobacillus caeni TaxID=2574798 RepID=A0A5R9F9P8_9BACL|nr:M4 family metallopeptidase [Pseudalkalibacillus caeni]TLS38358.1 peptidase M4 family protein [Pseudalkalibacillus caeni]
MKKSLALALATGLVFSSGLPGVNAMSDDALQQKAMDKMEIVQKNFDKNDKVPSFLSGKLSEKSYNTEKEIKTYLKENSDLFKLNPKTDLTLLDVKTDELGMKHYEYIQSVKGVPVEGAKFIVHTDKEGKVTAVNGTVHPTASADVKTTSPKLSKQDAIEKAWDSIDLTKAETNNNGESGEAPSFVKNSDMLETAEKGKLVVHEKNGKFSLAYKVELQFIDPYPANWQIFVDARDGSIVEAYNAVTASATSGYGYGVNGGYKALNTYYSSGTYYLYDVTKPMSGVIRTTTAKNGTSIPGWYSVDSNNAWTAYSQGADVDAHYNAGKVYDYYYNTHNRNSYDNSGSTLTSTVHYGSNYNNAFWNGSQMVYGDGDGSTFAPLSGALDVVAHELTHAVTERTAGLQYQYQSGALNESMSDVFGYFLDSGDWLMGEDVYTPGVGGDALRSLSNPEAYGQPSHMNDYVNTSSDNGGVHTNSGIPNKAGYLTISSIGKSAAEKIYYRALTVYLTPTSDFSDARAALLQSAADYYGSGSSTYNAVANAWNQVGVY